MISFQGTRHSGKGLKGKNIANPLSILFSSCDMLEYLGWVWYSYNFLYFFQLEILILIWWYFLFTQEVPNNKRSKIRYTVYFIYCYGTWIWDLSETRIVPFFLNIIRYRVFIRFLLQFCLFTITYIFLFCSLP